jgi:Acetyl-CoA carboxylase, carboxyltransferase component (subunits alpha and beta)
MKAVSNARVLQITVMVGASDGAGTYAMSGKAFNNRIMGGWLTAKKAVRGPEQKAGVRRIVRKAKAKREGKGFDEKAEEQLKIRVVEYLEKISKG